MRALSPKSWLLIAAALAIACVIVTGCGRTKSSTQTSATGPSYSASIRVTETGPNAVKMDLLLNDAAGKPFKIDKKFGNPGFEVLDASGKVVWQGNFKYG